MLFQCAKSDITGRALIMWLASLLPHISFGNASLKSIAVRARRFS